MPLYEYQCETCRHRFELIQKFSDPPPATCPKCEGPVEKLVSSPAIQFKGSGFYLTDYGRGGKSDTAPGKDGQGKDGQGEAGAKGEKGEKGEKADKSDAKEKSAKPDGGAKGDSAASSGSRAESGGGKSSDGKPAAPASKAD